MTARASDALLKTVVNNDGIVEAQTLGEMNGRIVLDGGDEGTVQVAGTLDASATLSSPRPLSRKRARGAKPRTPSALPLHTHKRRAGSRASPAARATSPLPCMGEGPGERVTAAASRSPAGASP
ncbi:hypothetical protein ACFS3C_05725 [Azotobacter vinelandii]